MRSLSDYLFDIGFFPLVHHSIKQDFLSWYFEASKNERISGNIAVDNSELVELIHEANRMAIDFDQTNPLAALVSTIEGIEGRIKTISFYVGFGAMFCGICLTAAGFLNILGTLVSNIFKLAGISVLIGTGSIYTAYKVLAHQVKTNSELVAKFNKELVEAPGDIRQNDQKQHRLVAQYFWNKSLLSPSTHICLIFLSVIRVISASFYGYIAGDIRNEITEFVGMNRREILKHQVKRGLRGEITEWPNDGD